MTTIDIMTRIGAPRYLEEILSIPVREQEERCYNGAAGGSGHCTVTRELGLYRARVLEEKRLKREILELSAALAAGKAPGGKLRHTRLRELYLRLGKVSLKRRQLEQLRDGIESEFVRLVVTQRYFSNLEQRIPTWTDTARQVGAAVSGDELRRYICGYLARHTFAG